MRVTRRHLRKRNRTNKKFKRNTKNKYIKRRLRKGGGYNPNRPYILVFSYADKNDDFTQIKRYKRLDFKDSDDAIKYIKDHKNEIERDIELNYGEPLSINVYEYNKYKNGRDFEYFEYFGDYEDEDENEDLFDD